MLRLRSKALMGSQRGARTPAVDHTGSQKRGPRITRNLKRRPVLYVILALMVLLFLSSMATGFDLAVKLNYILVLLLIVSWLWSSAGANQLDAEVRRPTGPFSVGDTVSERITVFNRGRTPKAWVEVEDQTNLPGVVFRHVTPLGIMVPFANASSEATLTKRGEFVIGPLVVRVADPFTLFPREIQFAGVEKMLVYPQVIPLPDFAAPNPYLVGEHSRRQRANMVSTDVSSVRDYVAGDSIGRIHWLSTARTGNLMVKQFDQGSSSHLWVVFDQFHGAQAGEGEDSTDEYGATLAASVVDRYSRGFLPVGYTGHGSESLVAAPDQSEAHRENVMRHIAASLPTGNIPLFEVLGDLERDFSQATSLVIITAAGDGEWVEALVGLQRRGVKVSVVVMDSASFGGADNSIAVERLVGSGIRTFRVHHGDSISGALSAPVGLVDTVDHVGSQEGGLLGSSTAPVPATTYSEMAPTAPIRPPTNNMASPEVVD